MATELICKKYVIYDAFFRRRGSCYATSAEMAIEGVRINLDIDGQDPNIFLFAEVVEDKT